MKTCLLCGTKASADTPTCSACGEATWSKVEKAVEPHPPPEPSTPAPDETATPEEPVPASAPNSDEPAPEETPAAPTPEPAATPKPKRGRR